MPSKVSNAPLGLSLQSITKQFGDVAAVNGITLEVEKGTFVCLVGPSGCGKTTTLRMVAGLEFPTQGVITLNGKTVSNPASGLALPPEERNLGMVFQSYAIWPHMTVEDNVGFGLKLLKYPKEKRASEVNKVLEIVGLKGFGTRYPSQLSGGQQQRVALARAVVTNPALLLFDEPLSNLDEKLRETMRLEIRALQQQLGTTSLYVTHSHQEALAIADLIGVMNAGKILQLASPRELYMRPTSTFVAEFVGFANIFQATIQAVSPDNIDISLEDQYAEAILRRPELEMEHGKPQLDQTMRVMCRPENIRIINPTETIKNNWLLAGTVRSAVFCGSYVEYFVKTASGMDVRVHQRVAEADAQVGQSVKMIINPRDLVALYD